MVVINEKSVSHEIFHNAYLSKPLEKEAQGLLLKASLNVNI